jgi:glycosyltransferase involved in cell wall biosynthesis
MSAYQKAESIEETILRLIAVLDRSFVVFQLIVVVDGPDKDCEEKLSNVRDERLSVLVLPQNVGKGAALRQGFQACTGDFVAFMDADLDLHPESLVLGLNLLASTEDPEVICSYGSKFHKDSVVQYPWMRRLASGTYRMVVRLIFGLDIEDSQTGMKVFSRVPLALAIGNCNESRFLFDIELMSILNNLGYKMVPIPVILDYQYSSSISLLSTLRMIDDTVKLGWRFRQTKKLLKRS